MSGWWWFDVKRRWTSGPREKSLLVTWFISSSRATDRRGDYALGTPIRNGRFWPFLSGLHQLRNVHMRIGFDQIWLKMYSKRIGVLFFSLQLGGRWAKFFLMAQFQRGRCRPDSMPPETNQRDFCTQVISEFTGYQRFLYSGRIGVQGYF